MKILSDDDGEFPSQRRGPIRQDLALVKATEIASYVMANPINQPGHTQFPAYDIFIAADRGLFVYHCSEGFDEPGDFAGGWHGEPWGLTGSFLPWKRVHGAELRLSLTWDPALDQHMRRPSLHVDTPAFDLSIPDSSFRPNFQRPARHPRAHSLFSDGPNAAVARAEM